jgi:hypothetical protein
MKVNDLKTAIQEKTAQFEEALEEGRSHSELLAVYKELKELKYQLVQEELALSTAVVLD